MDHCCTNIAVVSGGETIRTALTLPSPRQRRGRQGKAARNPMAKQQNAGGGV
ncbi:MAG: hypothetical protein ABFC84_01615 [Veillonellales bacterium]